MSIDCASSGGRRASPCERGSSKPTRGTKKILQPDCQRRRVNPGRGAALFHGGKLISANSIRSRVFSVNWCEGRMVPRSKQQPRATDMGGAVMEARGGIDERGNH